MQIENKNNLSFKSNIRFVSEGEFKKLLKTPTSKVEEMWEIEKLQEIHGRGMTEDIMYCVAGLITSIKDSKDYIFHWYPDELLGGRKQSIKLPNFQVIINHFASLKQNEKTKGLIIGGTSSSVSKTTSRLSTRVLNAIKRPLTQEQRNNFSLFFAQNSPHKYKLTPQSEFIYSKRHDTYYIHSGVKSDEVEDEFVTLNTKEQIKDGFDFIHISDNDKVFVGLESDEAIPNEFWKKNLNTKKFNS